MATYCASVIRFRFSPCHTATSLLEAAGVSEAVARPIIGHDSAECPHRYTHINDEAKRIAGGGGFTPDK